MADDGVDRRDLLRFGLIATFATPIWALPGHYSDALAAEPPAAGLVRAVSGRAEAEREAQMRLLSPDGRVFTGDRITTAAGARAVLALGATTELRLGSAARVRIDRFLINAGGIIDLENGSVLIDKRPESGGSLSLRSSHGLIAVRGTRFFAGPSNGKFGVFVERGSVAVSGGGRQVVLKDGEGTEIARPGAPPDRPSVWRQERIQAALAQVY